MDIASYITAVGPSGGEHYCIQRSHPLYVELTADSARGSGFSSRTQHSTLSATVCREVIPHAVGSLGNRRTPQSTLYRGEMTGCTCAAELQYTVVLLLLLKYHNTVVLLCSLQLCTMPSIPRQHRILVQQCLYQQSTSSSIIVHMLPRDKKWAHLELDRDALAPSDVLLRR